MADDEGNRDYLGVLKRLAPKRGDFSEARARELGATGPFLYQDRRAMLDMRRAKNDPLGGAPAAHYAREHAGPVLITTEGEVPGGAWGAYNYWHRNPPLITLRPRQDIRDEADTLAHELGHHVHQAFIQREDPLLPKFEAMNPQSASREQAEDIADAFEDPTTRFTGEEMNRTYARVRKVLRDEMYRTDRQAMLRAMRKGLPGYEHVYDPATERRPTAKGLKTALRR